MEDPDQVESTLAMSGEDDRLVRPDMLQELVKGGGDVGIGKVERLACILAVEEEGTEGRPFEVHVISFDAYTVEGVHQLEEMGVTDVIVGFRNPYLGADTVPLDDKIGAIRRFGDDVIAKA